MLKYGGPHRGASAGQPLGVFIDCCALQHRLTPDPQARARGLGDDSCFGAPPPATTTCTSGPHPSPPQAFRPCPVDLDFRGGLFYLVTHTTREQGPSYGCLSVWGREGELLAAHALGERYLHPNGLSVY